MMDLIKRMNEGKEKYVFLTPDRRPVEVHGDSEKEAHEKFNEYMGWD